MNIYIFSAHSPGEISMEENSSLKYCGCELSDSKVIWSSWVSLEELKHC